MVIQCKNLISLHFLPDQRRVNLLVLNIFQFEEIVFVSPTTSVIWPLNFTTTFGKIVNSFGTEKKHVAYVRNQQKQKFAKLKYFHYTDNKH